METNRIIDKIRKLLALATSPNEEEAAAAAMKAQELLARHNILREQVETVVTATEPLIEVVVSTPRDAWRQALGQATGRLYFSVHYVDMLGEVTIDDHTFVGEVHNASVAALMFGYLSDTVERLAQVAAETNPDPKYAAAFRNGCAARLFVRLNERFIASTKGKLDATGTTLPALTNLYQRALTKIMPMLANKGLVSDSVALRGEHKQGWDDGRAAADRVGLDTQIAEEGVERIGAPLQQIT